MDVRPATLQDIDPLADIWYSGWVEAHADHVPKALVELRTLESFKARLTKHIDRVLVVGKRGAPLGFCLVKSDELDQLFVSSAARGTGVADALIQSGEQWIRDDGHSSALLFCEPNNHRAIRFYEKSGWRNSGLSEESVETSEGPFKLQVIKFRKAL